ncbi:hypothetical protein PILCRDRAFT_61066, partial [Piloderma croceum F 1598]
LDSVVNKVKEKVISKVKGKRAMGQCDGWDNIVKTHVVTSMITVEHEVTICTTHFTGHKPVTGNQLLELVLDDIKHIKDKFGVKVIGWCTDDGLDGKKMQRLLRTSLI